MKKKKPIQVIREMNLGIWIPSGAEMARLLRKLRKKK